MGLTSGIEIYEVWVRILAQAIFPGKAWYGFRPTPQVLYPNGRARQNKNLVWCGKNKAGQWRGFMLGDRFHRSEMVGSRQTPKQRDFLDFRFISQVRGWWRRCGLPRCDRYTLRWIHGQSHHRQWQPLQLSSSTHYSYQGAWAVGKRCARRLECLHVYWIYQGY